MTLKKTAETSTTIEAPFAERWSPRAFAQDAVTLADLAPAFEAARWAPSANNSQPWRFYAASKTENPEGFAKLLALLVPANAIWAQDAAVLIVTAAELARADGKVQTWATYDLGQAALSFTVQATADGYHAHQMGGFDAEAATATLNIAAPWQAVTMIAVGKIGAPENLPEKYAERELTPRSRKGLDEIILAV